MSEPASGHGRHGGRARHRGRAVLTLAGLTLREHVRSRLLTSALLVAGGLLLVGIVGAGASVFARTRLVLDLGLSAASLVGTVLAVACTFRLLTAEGHQASEYLLLSRPIGRTELLLGRYLGLLGLLAAFVGIVALGCALGCGLAGGLPPAALGPASWQTWVELALTLAIAFALASACGAPLGVTLFALLFVAGQLADELRLLAERHVGDGLGRLAAAAFCVLPDYRRLSLREYAGAEQSVPMSLLLDATLYGLLSAAAWLTVAGLLYIRRARTR